MNTPEARNTEIIAAALAKLRTRRSAGIVPGSGKHGVSQRSSRESGGHSRLDERDHDAHSHPSPHHHSAPQRGSHGGVHGGRGGGRGGRGGMALTRMLEALASSETALSVSEIGEEIGVDQPRASRLVQQAVAHGLTLREADPDDARRTRVALTEEGRVRADRTRAERRVPLERALTALEDDEQAELARLLTKLAAHWTAAQ